MRALLNEAEGGFSSGVLPFIIKGEGEQKKK